ncbi:MAG: TnpV protein [Oscillibacter sp.]|nr:TnpV protein [Oscillibacter sp.]
MPFLGKRLALDLPPAGGKLCEAFLEKRKARYRRVSVRQYCAEIDEAARNRMELIVPKLAKQYGVTEQLKADNQMEWVRQMNACKAQAEEIVKAELIYD